MKKLSILLLLLPLVLAGCKSKEDKAAELIKTELSKTLYDFESYSPIETIVTEAKQSIYTDTVYLNTAKAMLYSFELASEYLEEAKEASERMDIWGKPTSYSSSYSDKQYYKYKEEWEENLEKATTYYDLVKVMSKSLKDSLQTIDTAKVVGWEVKHRFRCKTKGGHSTIGDYRYVINKDFTEIIIYEDTDNKDYKKLRELVEEVMDWDLE